MTPIERQLSIRMVVHELKKMSYNDLITKCKNEFDYITVTVGERQFGAEVRYRDVARGVAVHIGIQPRKPRFLECGTGMYYLVGPDGNWSEDGSIAF